MKQDKWVTMRNIKRLKPKVLVQGDPDCVHFEVITGHIGIYNKCGRVKDYSINMNDLSELEQVFPLRLMRREQDGY